jgi:hypothetical protein
MEEKVQTDFKAKASRFSQVLTGLRYRNLVLDGADVNVGAPMLATEMPPAVKHDDN